MELSAGIKSNSEINELIYTFPSLGEAMGSLPIASSLSEREGNELFKNCVREGDWFFKKSVGETQRRGENIQ